MIRNQNTVKKMQKQAEFQKNLPEWIAFKKKWNGKSPDHGTKLFHEYSADLMAVSKILEENWKKILKEN